jgi:Zn-finger protein
MCYCPLSPYEDCDGNYKILDNGWKDCSDCVIPHYDYDFVIDKLRKLHEKHGTFNKKGN